MSGDPLDLERITGPATPPPTAADSLTQKEIKKANRPTPADRHAASVALHIEDICRDRDRLRNEYHRIQGEFDQLKPEYSRLREAYGNALFNNLVSTLLIAVGSLLVSGAGYSAYKTQILWSGISTFLCGILLLGLNTIRGAFTR